MTQKPAVQRPHESELLSWFCSESDGRESISRLLGLQCPDDVYVNVPRRVFPRDSETGDTDIVVDLRGDGELLAAIECKRLMYRTVPTGDSLIWKDDSSSRNYGKIRKIARQCGQLLDHGFTFVGALLIPVLDARYHPYKPFCSTLLQDGTVRDIADRMTSDLPDEVGIMITILAETDAVKPFPYRAATGFRLQRRATELPQDSDLSDRFRKARGEGHLKRFLPKRDADDPMGHRLLTGRR